MLNGRQLLNDRSKSGGRDFLKPTDLPMGTKQICVLVTAVGENPGNYSPAYIEIDDWSQVFLEDGGEIQSFKVPRSFMAINVTNLRDLVSMVGQNIEDAVDKFLTFRVLQTRGPREQWEPNFQLIGLSENATAVSAPPIQAEPPKRSSKPNPFAPGASLDRALAATTEPAAKTSKKK